MVYGYHEWSAIASLCQRYLALIFMNYDSYQLMCPTWATLAARFVILHVLIILIPVLRFSTCH
jgi:hypothetical protein